MRPTIIRNIKPKVVTNSSRRFVTFSKLGRHGRLGNQLFQIAAVIGYSYKHGVSIKLPVWYCNYDKINYSIYFKNKIDQTLNPIEIKYNFKEPKFEYSEIPSFPGPVDLHGYFQSEKYFEHCLREVANYLQPSDSILSKIDDKYKYTLSGETCSIHIRRGDYVGSRIHDVCNLDYYNRCIEFVKQKGINKFLIFSDDIKWCKGIFTDSNFYFIEGNNPVEDLFIMASCKHNIISNSSFSWWGSWLNSNPNKIVCAPSKWFTDSSPIKQYESLYRKDMIKI